jgi:predicted O-methyltransferase YrrM
MIDYNFPDSLMNSDRREEVLGSYTSRKLRFDGRNALKGREGTLDGYLRHMKGQPVHFLEIGSFEGRSAVWFFKNILTHEESTLTCIDVCVPPASYNLVSNLMTLGVLHTKRCELISKPSSIALRSLPYNHFDFVWIDGNHATANVLEDAVLSFPLLKVGGWMGFDDIGWQAEPPDVTDAPEPAVKAFTQCYKRMLKCADQGLIYFIEKIEHTPLES